MAARILVVDDEPQVLQLLRDILSRESYEVITASDGLEGWNLVCEEHPDLIITDIMMPRMDGFDLVRRVRSHPLVQATPLMILSAKTQEEDQLKGLQLGADDYLTKPFGIDVFVQRVRTLLDLRQSRVRTTRPPTAGPFAAKGMEVLARYTFDTFVVGESNLKAVDAAWYVVGAVGVKFNPLFIFGGPGVGKTHLMAAMANAMYKADPSLRILYLTSETFSQQIMEAYERRTVDQLITDYLSCDVLFIDDIQFLAVSPTLQQVAARTILQMCHMRRQVVASADRPPQDLPTLTEEMSKSFASGLVVGIDPPDARMRAAVVRAKALQQGWRVPLDLLDELARRLESDLRTLEGAAKKLVALSSMGSLPLDRTAVDRIVASVREDAMAAPCTVPTPSPQAAAPEPTQATYLCGSPAEVAATLPQAERAVVVHGISATLVADTVRALAGLPPDPVAVAQGASWACASFPQGEVARWLVVGTNSWQTSEELRWAVRRSRELVSLAVLDTAGGRVTEARALVAALPKEYPAAVVALFAGTVGAHGQARRLLTASMRRLFRVPEETVVIVDCGVSAHRAREWVEAALAGSEAG